MLGIEEKRKAIDALTENYGKTIDGLIAAKSGNDDYAGDYIAITSAFQKALDSLTVG